MSMLAMDKVLLAWLSCTYSFFALSDVLVLEVRCIDREAEWHEEGSLHLYVCLADLPQ